MKAFDVRAPRVGRPVRPNAGIRVAYRRKLMTLIDEMYRSIDWWIVAEYKRQLPRIMEYDRAADAAVPRWRRLLNRIPALDASPAADLRRQLRRRLRQWQRTFDERAGGIARWFMEQSLRAATAAAAGSVAAALDVPASALGIDWQMTRAMNNAIASIVFENTALIRSIPQKDFLELEGVIMRAARTGYDAGRLAQDLEQRFRVTSDRAKFIARDQLNKATESLTRIRMQEIGIEEAVWIHTRTGKTWRSTHVAFNRQQFRLDKGLYDTRVNKWVQPGELPNCYCTKAPVIPGMAAPRIARIQEAA